MSKRVILEVRGLPGQTRAGGTSQPSNQPGQLPVVSQAAVAKNKVQEVLFSQQTTDILKSASDISQSRQDVNNTFIKWAKNGLNPASTQQRLDTMYKLEAQNAIIDKELDGAAKQLSTNITKAYVDDSWRALKDNVKTNLKTLNTKMAPVLYYGTQAFALYHKSQMNTYQMSGMTSSAIRQQQFAQGLSLAQELTTTSIAFMINPVLGAVQLAMSAINRISDYHERSRQFEYNKAKDEYSANYYRSRLVNNMKVVI